MRFTLQQRCDYGFYALLLNHIPGFIWGWKAIVPGILALTIYCYFAVLKPVDAEAA